MSEWQPNCITTAKDGSWVLVFYEKETYTATFDNHTLPMSSPIEAATGGAGEG